MTRWNSRNKRAASEAATTLALADSATDLYRWPALSREMWASMTPTKYRNWKRTGRFAALFDASARRERARRNAR